MRRVGYVSDHPNGVNGAKCAMACMSAAHRLVWLRFTSDVNDDVALRLCAGHVEDAKAYRQAVLTLALDRRLEREQFMRHAESHGYAYAVENYARQCSALSESTPL